MIKVGIIGGAGYTAGELLRLLVRHDGVSVEFVQSSSQAGLPITDVHPDLYGELSSIFVPKATAAVDVLFLCAGHGRSRAYLASHPVAENVKVIDLSNEYRLSATAEGFVYGLPELNRAQIVKTSQLANPGCFATAIQLALLPLAEADLLRNDVHVHALTGSTGAGQQASAKTHFSWRDSNVSIYKPFVHQHLDEIQQSVRQLQPGFDQAINFLPLRGNFARGIFASLYTACTWEEGALQELYNTYYQQHPFVHVTNKNPDLKQVVNTNKCHLYVQKYEGKVLIVSILDNLLKGASGQAVQNMNLMCGLEETAGLQLKATAF